MGGHVMRLSPDRIPQQAARYKSLGYEVLVKSDHAEVTNHGKKEK